jgi:hypothetical protein
MLAVKAGIISLVESVRSGQLYKIPTISQNRELELRYSRVAEFDESVAENFMNDPPEYEIVMDRIKNRDLSMLQNPFVLSP